MALRAVGRFSAENGFAAQGAVKVIAAEADGRILGVHVVGSYASEMIWGAAALVESGATLAQARELVFPHPTVCEAIREVIWAIE